MGGDLVTSPPQRVGVIDRWCCQIPTHPQPVPQGGIVGQTIDRCITMKYFVTVIIVWSSCSFCSSMLYIPC